MALDVRYFLTLAILVQLTNVSNACSPAEIQFQHTYCTGSLNGSVIVNEPDSSKVLGICVDVIEEHKQISQYRQTLKCEESEDCLSAKQSILTNCVHRVLPLQFNGSILWEPKFAEINNNSCSPTEIKFQHKYCKGSFSSNVIANQSVVKILDICSDTAEKLKELSEYQDILKCKDSDNCLFAMLKTARDCIRQIMNAFHLEFNGTTFVEQTLPEIDETSLLILDTTLGILFLVGIMSNVLLSVIVIRHKSARNDMMLVNLVVADVLSLAINMVLFIVNKSYGYTNYATIFISGTQFCNFICQYGLVTTSFQRFRAVSNKIQLGKEKTFSNWVKIICLWIIGSLYLILHYLLGYTFDNSKKFSYRTNAFIIQLSLTAFIGGVVPLVLIAVFSILASTRLKKLTENVPGERNHHLQRIKDRYLTSKALIALAMLCASTYLPYDVAVTVILTYYPDIEDFVTHLATGVGTWFWVIKFAQAALLLNPALNPLVLYFLSSKFRRYFKAYLCCRTRDLD